MFYKMIDLQSYQVYIALTFNQQRVMMKSMGNEAKRLGFANLMWSLGKG